MNKMKPVLQFATSVVALGALLGGAVSSNAATSIAELPLKASVLAKPNVIWGFDNSGSMDFEVMLQTNDGALWWNYTDGNGWDATGKPHFYDTGAANTTWRKYTYLFPNGNTAGARKLADNSSDHFAIMPTAQFAWLRSAAYNPIYYDPAITYKPWSPAYIGSAVVNYANASTTAVKSHPIYGTETIDLTANLTTPNTQESNFVAMPGMIIPAGAQHCAYSDNNNCTGAGTTTAASDYTVPAGTVRRVLMTYYPATYYVKDAACTVDCVTAPDGAKLKRYEIRSTVTSYPSGRSYAAELQNFANWFQYYRKRKLMANAAIGQVLEPLTGLRMGMVKFNSNSAATMYDTDSTNPALNGRKLAGLFYETDSSGGTPTRETLKYIGEQYRNSAFPVTSSSIIQYACQRNNAFILTDGFANADTVTPPSYTQSTWGNGAPYQNVYAGTLSDIALSYYTINLKSDFATGKVAQTSVDLNTNLHMNTYGMTLGAKGTLYQGDTSVPPTNAADWPNPSSFRSPTSVDDLWHATINGRGKMYTAATPTETAQRIQAAMQDILSAVGAQSGVAVSSVNLSRGDGFAYLARYNPSGWSGDLTANAINPATGAISNTSTWSGAALLNARDHTTRQIVTQTSAGTGQVFNATNVGATVNPGDIYGSSADVISYLRGNRAQEGTAFRTRTSLIGAAINAEPAIDAETGVAYLASGEGMLHAFDTRAGTERGKELWAFVPRAVLPDIGATTARAYVFKTQLDGTPVIRRIGTSTRLLVAGMGAAGRSYYALDVTNARTQGESDTSWVKWEFPSPSDATTVSKVGQTMGKPLIVNTTAGYRVVVTSGYNSTFDGKGRLFVLNADTGAVEKEFTTTDGSLADEAGLTHVSPYVEDNGMVRYVYGGDLLGNLWKFDLNAATGSTPAKVAELKGPSGAAQPVTAAPELALIKGKRVIFIGTGRLLNVGDFGSTAVQTFYAIADGTTLSNARSSLVAQTYTAAGDDLTTNPVTWTADRGWYVDLPAGHQANTRPSLGFGAVAFTTNKTGATDCSASGYLWMIDAIKGTQMPGLDYVATELASDANVSAVNLVRTRDGGGSGGTTPSPSPSPSPTPSPCPPGSVVSQVQDTNGRITTTCGPAPTSIAPTRNAWREVRPR